MASSSNIQSLLPYNNTGRASRKEVEKTLPCLALDAYSFAYSDGAAGGVVSLGLAVTTLALSYLPRTSCRFPGSSEIGLLQRGRSGGVVLRWER